MLKPIDWPQESKVLQYPACCEAAGRHGRGQKRADEYKHWDPEAYLALLAPSLSTGSSDG